MLIARKMCLMCYSNHKWQWFQSYQRLQQFIFDVTMNSKAQSFPKALCFPPQLLYCSFLDWHAHWVAIVTSKWNLGVNNHFSKHKSQLTLIPTFLSCDQKYLAKKKKNLGWSSVKQIPVGYKSNQWYSVMLRTTNILLRRRKKNLT